MDRNEAPKVLVAVAEAAQDVAAGLNQFLNQVPNSDVDITSLIGKCYQVSSSLRELATAIEESRRLSQYHGISDEVTDVARSLDHTFKDVHQIVGEGFEDTRKAGKPRSSGFRRVWRNITDHFHKESGNTLERRLELCRKLLDDLCDVIHEG